MTDLSLATLFTGAVILGWGWRALRNRQVNALFFKLRGRHSTWIFGFVAVIAGLLMLLSGLSNFNALSPERVESFAKAGLYVFGIGWALALLMEVMDRIIWRLDPQLAPADLRAKPKGKRLTKRKRQQKVKRQRKDEAPDEVEPRLDAYHEEAAQVNHDRA